MNYLAIKREIDDLKIRFRVLERVFLNLPIVKRKVVVIVSNLPPHIQPTFLATRKLGRVTAQEVADTTGRARAVESAYLNSMVVMGVMEKERVGRTVFFWISPDALVELISYEFKGKK